MALSMAPREPMVFWMEATMVLSSFMMGTELILNTAWPMAQTSTVRSP